MQLYVLDRAKNTLATTADFYNDTHIKTVSTGSSTFEFDIDKTDEAALYMNSGNYIVFNDDKGRSWSFSILSYEEHQTSKTIYCEDVGIELINKNMDIWETDQAYSFEYYFNLIAKDTPWKLGVNQLAGLSRKLTYTGRDTGLGRLLSVLTGFDKAECQFNIKVQQNRPVEFTVDVYKTIGTIQDNIQIVYGNELNDIKKTESRAEFVTAVQGVGGAITPPEGTEVDPNAPEVKVDFKDLEYKDDNLETTKGDPFLRAVKANKLFNPGDQGYIESYYEYDTQSNTELLNRTITQLNTYSEPQYTYEADVQVIDPTLDIGDTVTIIDHDYNPALYLRARVATLEKSYSDPSKGSITFTNYELLNSSLAGKLRDLQSIINSMPSNSTIQIINSNLSLLAQAQKEAAEKLQVMMESADGKNSLYYNYRPANAKEGDMAFVKNPDSGNMEIWNYVGGQWTLTAGDATFDGLKTQIDKAQADAQTAITNANTAVSTANQAVSAAGFANNTADQAKTAAANAQDEASSAFAKADSAVASALSAQNDASNAVTQASSAAADSKDAKKIAGAVSQSYKTLTDGSTMTIAELQNGLAVKLTKDDLNGYATETWAQNQIDVSADGINGTMSSIKSTVDGQTTSINDLKADSSSFKSQFTTVNDTLGKQTTDIGTLQVTSKELTTGFNTLTTDNGTNKNDISQLKQTATEVSSTLETVQTQVQNSSVGTNLLLDSQTRVRKPSWFSTNISWTNDWGTYLGSNIHRTTYAWDNDRYNYKDLLDRGVINTTDDFTYSIYFRVVGEDPAGMSYSKIMFFSEAASKYGQEVLQPTSLKEGQWVRLVVPIKFNGVKYDPTNIYGQSIRVEASAAPKVAGAHYEFAAPKLEKVSVATDYSVNPEDTATVTAVSKISQTVEDMKFDVSKKIEQKDLNGYATQSWSQGQLSIAKNEITASVQNMTSDMATQKWTQGQLKLTADGFTSQISSIQNGLNEKYTQLQQTLDGVQVTANNAVTQAQLTLLSNQFTSKIGPIDLTTGTVSSKITQLQDDINLRVQNENVISQINISPESILIAGQKVHITGQTTIDSGIITNAMISNATIDAAKIKDGAITNAKIANLDGGKITANSITANKLNVNSMLVGINEALGTGVNLDKNGLSVVMNGKYKAGLGPSGLIFGDSSHPDGIGGIMMNSYSGINGLRIQGDLLLTDNIYGRGSIANTDWINGGRVHFENLKIDGSNGIAIINDLQTGIFFSNNGSLWLANSGKWTKERG